MLSALDLLETRGLPRRISLLSEIEAETLDRFEQNEDGSLDTDAQSGLSHHSRSWNGVGSKGRRHSLLLCTDAGHTTSFSTSRIKHKTRGLSAAARCSTLSVCVRPSWAQAVSTAGPKRRHNATFPGNQRIRRRSWCGVVSIISEMRKTVEYQNVHRLHSC